MARVSGPFLSVTASGTVAKTLTASSWKGIAYIRQWFRPENPKTVEQVKQRTRLTKAVLGYQSLSEQNKAVWDEAAVGQQMSGFNLYCKKFVNYMIANDDEEPTAPFLP